MQQALEIPHDKEPQELVKLIHKLRWIGMDDEARRLQTALGSLPANQRSSVSAGPFNTD